MAQDVGKVSELKAWAMGQSWNLCLRTAYAKLTRSLRGNLYVFLLSVFFSEKRQTSEKRRLLKEVYVFSLEFQWTSSLLHYNTQHTKKKTAYAKLLTQQVSSKKLTLAYATQVLAYARPWYDTTNTTHIKGCFLECSFKLTKHNLLCFNFQLVPFAAIGWPCSTSLLERSLLAFRVQCPSRNLFLNRQPSLERFC